MNSRTDGEEDTVDSAQATFPRPLITGAENTDMCLPPILSCSREACCGAWRPGDYDELKSTGRSQFTKRPCDMCMVWRHKLTWNVFLFMNNMERAPVVLLSLATQHEHCFN